MDAAHTDLNTFSNALWADAAVEAACLKLQDECGADIPLVLFALYRAARGAALDEAALAAAQDIAQDWTPAVVAPLRAARRALKTRDTDLYMRAKAVEIEAERALLARLQTLAGAVAGAADADLARANLQALLGAAAVEGLHARTLLARWSAHAGATIESRGEAGAMVSGLDSKEALAQLTQLRAEHRALDQEVAALGADAMADQLKLVRLKRQKLALKDRIARLEDEIHPDIIA